MRHSGGAWFSHRLDSFSRRFSTRMFNAFHNILVKNQPSKLLPVSCDIPPPLSLFLMQKFPERFQWMLRGLGPQITTVAIPRPAERKRTELVQINNVELLSSYNWVETGSPPIIMVPGETCFISSLGLGVVGSSYVLWSLPRGDIGSKHDRETKERS